VIDALGSKEIDCMNDQRIPFNWPHMTGKELYYIAEAHFNGRLAGDGPFTKRCHQWLEERTGCAKALLTHSCTAALEMAALLLDIQPGDEVIMPSYTFVSTANAFVLRGGVPVFVDIREDTLNLDEKLIESAITSKTKAIAPVHYAGVACEMDEIMAVALRHDLRVVEDAAQGVMSTYKGRALGSIGHFGAYSFHETKNVISGEGGALLVNDPATALRAEVIREKGTDRSRFFRGEVDKYTWQEVGSSFLPGDLIAAFLWAQFEEADRVTQAPRSVGSI
jgi:dTDP-4-amino-4,6-dideoxygalactose transaminase